MFVDFRQNATPEWSIRADLEHVARQFVTKDEAISVRDELRALGINPQIVNWDREAKKQTVIRTSPPEEDISNASHIMEALNSEAQTDFDLFDSQLEREFGSGAHPSS